MTSLDFQWIANFILVGLGIITLWDITKAIVDNSNDAKVEAILFVFIFFVYAIFYKNLTL